MISEYCALIIIFFSCTYKCENKVLLQSNGSIIVGKKMFTVFENNPYTAFWKISYAEPPLHDFRFKPPRRHQLQFYQNTHDFSKPYNDTCSSGMTEDCLYLSIYMPMSETKTNFPVLVWIHEQSNRHEPDFLIDEGVLVVTVSYRTSILGFLNTGDDFAGGNMGAKDAIMALKWIRENIILFNGDVNKVTVIGSGASANLVAALILSTASEDLFSRVVIQSGSALDPADYYSYNVNVLSKIFTKLNGRHFNRETLYKILLETSIKDLTAVAEDLFDSTEVRDNQRFINCFGPSIELTKKHAFMSKHPVDVYKTEMSNNNVDVMLGYTSLENVYKLKGFVKNRKLLKYLNYNFQYLLPFEGTSDEYDSERYRKIASKIMDFYFVNRTIGEGSLRRYAKYLSDQVIYPLLRQAKLHTQASYGNVYLYRFKFRGSLNIGWNSIRNLNYSGATARDEICYLFRCKSANDAYRSVGAAERQFIKKMGRLWANFAKCGNPTPKTNDDLLGELNWKPLMADDSLRGFSLGDKIQMVNVPEEKRMKFWDVLRKEFFTDDMERDEL